MKDVILSFTSWSWAILGLVLLILELIVPGVFFVWLGIGALLTALVVGICGSFLSADAWQVQILLFLVFSVIMVLVGRNFFRDPKRTDQPLLNQRTTQMIGQTAVLIEPLSNGHGRMRIDDTIWRVTGKDLPEGTKVRLIGFHDGAFSVEGLAS